MVVDFVMFAVAGARRTPGRLKTGGVPPKPPATNLYFSVALGVLGLRIVVQDVAASFSFALLRQRSRRCGAIQVAHVIQTDPEDLERLTCSIANVWPIPRTSLECCRP